MRAEIGRLICIHGNRNGGTDTRGIVCRRGVTVESLVSIEP